MRSWLAAPRLLRVWMPDAAARCGDLTTLRLRCLGWGRLQVRAPDRPDWPGIRLWLKAAEREIELVVPTSAALGLSLRNPFGHDQAQVAVRPGRSIDLDRLRIPSPPAWPRVAPTLPKPVAVPVSVASPTLRLRRVGATPLQIPCARPIGIRAAPRVALPGIAAPSLRAELPRAWVQLRDAVDDAPADPELTTSSREGSPS